MKRLSFLLLLAGMAGFAFAVLHLFQLRFASGDVYPSYSSLRSDPLGVKAFFQSLEQLLPTQRNFQPLSKLDARSTTLFYLGLDAANLQVDLQRLRELEAFANTGGRLVISLYANDQPARRAGPFVRPAHEEENIDQPSRGSRRRLTSADATESTSSLDGRWGFQIGFVPVLRDQTGRSIAEARLQAENAAGLPDHLRWPSVVVLTNLDPAWRIVYSRPRQAAVMVEREFDQGTVVIVTDSYLFSNEALWQEPQTSLLTWLIGPARRAVFDETHFGMAEHPGVATLLQKYRLHGFFAALLLLAGLFVWKNTVSLVPARTDQAGPKQTTVQGKEASAGLINLLRRNVPASGVLDLCFAEWKKTCSHGWAPARLKQVQAVMNEHAALPPKERQPLLLYRRISEVLARRI